MFSAAKLSKNFPTVFLQTRNKTKIHWAKLKKKDGPKHKAMDHFNEFYGSVFGKQWEPIKEALLRKSKYVAVVNNYGDTEETMELLSNKGAHCLKKLLSIQQKFNEEYLPPAKEDNKNVEDHSKVSDFASRRQAEDILNVYPKSSIIPEKLEAIDITLNSSQPNENETMSKTSQYEDDYERSRLIDPELGTSSELLHQFMPPTRLKGMEEWLPESLHYAYYKKPSGDFPLVVVPETKFSFPEHLKVYTYEMGSDYVEFPYPKRGKTGVFNYYPMDGGSILPVLALCLEPGDRVLDMCSAPGGKALVALQTLLPQLLVCNDISISRSNRSQRTFKDYLYDFGTNKKWQERVQFTRIDGLELVDDVGFDKVLVDVPCTTDRHSVTVDENNIFRNDRIKERLKIPELQSALLTNALKLTKVGGAVVYSTCSLSPIQNDGVVHMALKNAFEMHGIVANIKDLTSCLSSFTSTLHLGKHQVKPKYGQIVTPSIDANFGPSYFARLERVQ